MSSNSEGLKNRIVYVCSQQPEEVSLELGERLIRAILKIDALSPAEIAVFMECSEADLLAELRKVTPFSVASEPPKSEPARPEHRVFVPTPRPNQVELRRVWNSELKARVRANTKKLRIKYHPDRYLSPVEVAKKELEVASS